MHRGSGGGARYLGRPGLTAAAFVPDPDGPPGSRRYRTGDLARLTTAGQLEYHGRTDHQVKILGQRIEPEEVETALRAHPDVAAAAVTTRPGPSGLQLTAHLVPAPGATIDPAPIRAWLAERLPAPAVPTWYAVIGELPLTPGGKLDRGALAALAAGSDTSSRSTSPPPGTATERHIAGIWAVLLELESGGSGRS